MMTAPVIWLVCTEHAPALAQISSVDQMPTVNLKIMPDGADVGLDSQKDQTGNVYHNAKIFFAAREHYVFQLLTDQHVNVHKDYWVIPSPVDSVQQISVLALVLAPNHKFVSEDVVKNDATELFVVLALLATKILAHAYANHTSSEIQICCVCLLSHLPNVLLNAVRTPTANTASCPANVFATLEQQAIRTKDVEPRRKSPVNRTVAVQMQNAILTSTALGVSVHQDISEILTFTATTSMSALTNLVVNTRFA